MNHLATVRVRDRFRDAAKDLEPRRERKRLALVRQPRVERQSVGNVLEEEDRPLLVDGVVRATEHCVDVETTKQCDFALCGIGHAGRVETAALGDEVAAHATKVVATALVLPETVAVCRSLLERLDEFVVAGELPLSLAADADLLERVGDAAVLRLINETLTAAYLAPKYFAAVAPDLYRPEAAVGFHWFLELPRRGAQFELIAEGVRALLHGRCITLTRRAGKSAAIGATSCKDPECQERSSEGDLPMPEIQRARQDGQHPPQPRVRRIMWIEKRKFVRQLAEAEREFYSSLSESDGRGMNRLDAPQRSKGVHGRGRCLRVAS